MDCHGMMSRSLINGFMFEEETQDNPESLFPVSSDEDD
jgi:hypothetical protein